MSTTSYRTQAYYQSPLPISVGKKPTHFPTSRYGVSSPDVSSSMPRSVAPSAYSNGYSAASSYAGSEYDSRNSASGLDLHEYVQDRFSNMSFDPLPMDRSLATQAQTSGKLNAKQREIMELQAQAQARLAKTRARFAEGMHDAKEVRRDLEWTQKRVSTLKTKAARKHPSEHKKARARYPSPEI